MFKNIFLTFSILILLFVFIFFFWGSSAVVPSNDYAKKLTFHIGVDHPVSDTFSLLTYNMGYLSGMTNNLPVERSKELFDNNLFAINQLLQKQKADIVLFQEIDFASARSFNVNQFEAMAHSVEYNYGAYAINWDKRYVPFPYWPIQMHFGKLLSGQAVLSHWPLYSNERIVLPKPQSNTFIYNSFYLDRLAQKVWVKINHDSLLIINVHFEAWDIKTREKQAEIVLDMFDEYNDNYPVIIAGDFNCIPPYNSISGEEKTIEMIISHTSISAVIDASTYLQSPGSFYTFSSEFPKEKIDYIFYSNKYFDCISAQVLHPKTFISDHLPLQATFVRK